MNNKCPPFVIQIPVYYTVILLLFSKGIYVRIGIDDSRILPLKYLLLLGFL